MRRIVLFFMQTKVLVVMGLLLVMSLSAFRMKQIILSDQLANVSLQSPVPTRPPQPSEMVFDINESYVCAYASRSAVLSNKQMFMEDKTATVSSYMLLKGDCLHSWQKQRGAPVNGQKICGFGQYINVLAMISKSGKITMGTVMDSLFNNELSSSMLPASHSALLSSMSSNNLQQLMKSCKQSEAISPNLFELPNSLTFKEVKLNK